MQSSHHLLSQNIVTYIELCLGYLQDDLTMSLLEKCKESLPLIQRIIESTSNDEAMLFDALNIHDELQLVISRHSEIVAASDSEWPKDQNACKPSDGSNPDEGNLPQTSGCSSTEKLVDCPQVGITGSDKRSEESADKHS